MMNEMMENEMEKTELSEEQMENVVGGEKKVLRHRPRKLSKKRPNKNNEETNDNNDGE